MRHMLVCHNIFCRPYIMYLGYIFNGHITKGQVIMDIICQVTYYQNILKSLPTGTPPTRPQFRPNPNPSRSLRVELGLDMSGFNSGWGQPKPEFFFSVLSLGRPSTWPNPHELHLINGRVYVCQQRNHQ